MFIQPSILKIVSQYGFCIKHKTKYFIFSCTKLKKKTYCMLYDYCTSQLGQAMFQKFKDQTLVVVPLLDSMVLGVL